MYVYQHNIVNFDVMNIINTTIEHQSQKIRLYLLHYLIFSYLDNHEMNYFN